MKKYVVLISEVILGAFCIIFFISEKMWGEVHELPKMSPGIGELTNGHVNAGDTVTRDNVDLVKDLLSLGIVECVEKGMILDMGRMVPLEELNPEYYLEASRKSDLGGGLIDEPNGQVGPLFFSPGVRAKAAENNG